MFTPTDGIKMIDLNLTWRKLIYWGKRWLSKITVNAIKSAFMQYNENINSSFPKKMIKSFAKLNLKY